MRRIFTCISAAALGALFAMHARAATQSDQSGSMAPASENSNQIFDVRAKLDLAKRDGASVTLINGACGKEEEAECGLGHLGCEAPGGFQIGYEGLSSKDLAMLTAKAGEDQPQLSFSIDGEVFAIPITRFDWGDMNSDWYVTADSYDPEKIWKAIQKARLAVILKVHSSSMKIPAPQLAKVAKICSRKP